MEEQSAYASGHDAAKEFEQEEQRKRMSGVNSGMDGGGGMGGQFAAANANYPGASMLLNMTQMASHGWPIFLGGLIAYVLVIEAKRLVDRKTLGDVPPEKIIENASKNAHSLNALVGEHSGASSLLYSHDGFKNLVEAPDYQNRVLRLHSKDVISSELNRLREEYRMLNTAAGSPVSGALSDSARKRAAHSGFLSTVTPSTKSNTSVLQQLLASQESMTETSASRSAEEQVAALQNRQYRMFQMSLAPAGIFPCRQTTTLSVGSSTFQTQGGPILLLSDAKTAESILRRNIFSDDATEVSTKASLDAYIKSASVQAISRLQATRLAAAYEKSTPEGHPGMLSQAFMNSLTSEASASALSEMFTNGQTAEYSNFLTETQILLKDCITKHQDAVQSLINSPEAADRSSADVLRRNRRTQRDLESRLHRIVHQQTTRYLTESLASTLKSFPTQEERLAFVSGICPGAMSSIATLPTTPVEELAENLAKHLQTAGWVGGTFSNAVDCASAQFAGEQLRNIAIEEKLLTSSSVALDPYFKDASVFSPSEMTQRTFHSASLKDSHGVQLKLADCRTDLKEFQDWSCSRLLSSKSSSTDLPPTSLLLNASGMSNANTLGTLYQQLAASQDSEFQTAVHLALVDNFQKYQAFVGSRASLEKDLNAAANTLSKSITPGIRQALVEFRERQALTSFETPSDDVAQLQAISSLKAETQQKFAEALQDRQQHQADLLQLENVPASLLEAETETQRLSRLDEISGLQKKLEQTDARIAALKPTTEAYAKVATLLEKHKVIQQKLHSLTADSDTLGINLEKDSMFTSTQVDRPIDQQYDANQSKYTRRSIFEQLERSLQQADARNQNQTSFAKQLSAVRAGLEAQAATADTCFRKNNSQNATLHEIGNSMAFLSNFHSDLLASQRQNYGSTSTSTTEDLGDYLQAAVKNSRDVTSAAREHLAEATLKPATLSAPDFCVNTLQSSSTGLTRFYQKSLETVGPFGLDGNRSGFLLAAKAELDTFSASTFNIFGNKLSEDANAPAELENLLSRREYLTKQKKTKTKEFSEVAQRISALAASTPLPNAEVQTLREEKDALERFQKQDSSRYFEVCRQLDAHADAVTAQQETTEFFTRLQTLDSWLADPRFDTTLSESSSPAQQELVSAIQSALRDRLMHEEEKNRLKNDHLHDPKKIKLEKAYKGLDKRREKLLDSKTYVIGGQIRSAREIEQFVDLYTCSQVTTERSHQAAAHLKADASLHSLAGGNRLQVAKSLQEDGFATTLLSNSELFQEAILELQKSGPGSVQLQYDKERHVKANSRTLNLTQADAAVLVGHSNSEAIYQHAQEVSSETSRTLFRELFGHTLRASEMSEAQKDAFRRLDIRNLARYGVSSADESQLRIVNHLLATTQTQNFKRMSKTEQEQWMQKAIQEHLPKTTAEVPAVDAYVPEQTKFEQMRTAAKDLKDAAKNFIAPKPTGTTM